MSSALPESHPALDRSNSNAKCPVSGLSHEFIAPKEGDSRSVCPALNAMANHGYIPRSGQNVTATDVYHGLRSCYGLNAGFAAFLSWGGFLAISRFGKAIPLYEIGRHNRVEHDASLVHRNTPTGEEYAPTEVDHDLVDAFLDDIKPTAGVDGTAKAKKANDERSSEEEQSLLLGLEDVARARVRREKEAGPLNKLQARVARGEIAIALKVFGITVGGKTGIPAGLLRVWIRDERLPDDWKPSHSTGLFDMLSGDSQILKLVKQIREEEDRKRD